MKLSSYSLLFVFFFFLHHVWCFCSSRSHDISCFSRARFLLTSLLTMGAVFPWQSPRSSSLCWGSRDPQSSSHAISYRNVNMAELHFRGPSISGDSYHWNDQSWLIRKDAFFFANYVVWVVWQMKIFTGPLRTIGSLLDTDVNEKPLCVKSLLLQGLFAIA